MKPIRLTVNGRQVVETVEARTHLADFLREKMNLTGTHLRCEQGVCGACTILIDGQPARSCITYAVMCDGAVITTIEGLDDDPVMAALRGAFAEEHGFVGVMLVGAALGMLHVPVPFVEPGILASVVTLGLLLGVLVLIRPVAAPIVLALFVVWLLGGFGWRRALLCSGAIIGLAVLLVSPWIVRNIRVMHEATLSTNTGDNLCMSRHVGATGTFDFDNNACFQGYENLVRPEFETKRDEDNRQRAVDFVRDHPGEELYQTFKADWDGSWASESYGDAKYLSDSTRDTVHRIGSDYYLVTLALTAAALVVLVRRHDRRDPRWTFIPLAILTVVVLPVVTTFGDIRFKVPALPLFALLAAVAIVALAARVDRRSQRS